MRVRSKDGRNELQNQIREAFSSFLVARRGATAGGGRDGGGGGSSDGSADIGGAGAGTGADTDAGAGADEGAALAMLESLVFPTIRTFMSQVMVHVKIVDWNHIKFDSLNFTIDPT